MCGIAGKISFNNAPVESEDLKKMTDSISHRGPDGEGFWINGNGRRVGLGHRRLAIIDLSESGHQPMHYEGGGGSGLTITFNGEIYNYIEVKAELQKKGYEFRTGTDTEVILAAYLEYGYDCLNHFDGMFAFALWDESKKQMFIARDRFGEKPLYYYLDDRQFIFASEMKAIFSNGIPKTVSEEMIFYYLAYDVVENPNRKAETFYRNIYQLPPAHYLTISRADDLKIRKYWDIDTENRSDISLGEAAARFRELFDESVRIRLRSDVAVGSSFSGGIDSSSVVASIITQNPGINLQTFTARFDDPDYDEGTFIQYMLDKYSFTANYCYPKENLVIDEMDKIFHHQEEPFGSTSIIAQWEVMKLAKNKNVTVLLDGQGADETIAGYYKYFTPFLMELYKPDKAGFSNQLRAINENLDMNLELSKSQYLYTRFPKLVTTLSSAVRPLTLKRITGDLSDEFYHTHKKQASPFRHFDNLNDSLYFDTFKYGLGKLLRFADRSSMAFSREVRLPYLSHKLVEFVFSLPKEFKINQGWSKYILRLGTEDILPKEISWRKDKKGFQAPASWLQNGIVRDLLDSSIEYLKRRNYIAAPVPENTWKYIMVYKTLASK